MSAASRRKGVTGEREAADVFQRFGWEVRGLEGSGDWIAFKNTEAHWYGGVTLHVEVKRQERLRIPEWLAQAAAEALPDVSPVVVFRQNKGQWYACLSLSDLLELIG